MVYKSEGELQAKCTMLFVRKYPEQAEKLFLVYNNPPNAIVGSKLKTMGLKKGTADQVYYAPKGRKLWIEYKIGYNRQTEDQERFQKMVEEYGELYAVVRDVVDFENLVTNLNL